MKSEDLFIQLLQTEKTLGEGLVKDYSTFYSGVKDDNLRLMMKELLLLGITQVKVANELIKYVQEKNPVSVIDAREIIDSTNEGLPIVVDAIRGDSIPKEIAGFNLPDCLIVELSPWDYGKFVMESMRHLTTNLDYSCIYVSVTKPLVVMREMMETAGADMSKMSFIECTTAPEIIGSISPESLTEINIRLDSILEGMSGRKIVVFDTISALRVYNKEPAILDYVSVVSKRAKVRGFGLIWLHVNSGKDEINPVMQTFVDKVVKF